MQKLHGHVLQPLTPWLQAQGFNAPPGWTTKTRCIPHLAPQQVRIEEAMQRMGQQLEAEIWRLHVRHGSFAGTLDGWLAERAAEQSFSVIRPLLLENIWQDLVSGSEHVPHEESLRSQFEQLDDHFILSPIDMK